MQRGPIGGLQRGNAVDVGHGIGRIMHESPQVPNFCTATSRSTTSGWKRPGPGGRDDGTWARGHQTLRDQDRGDAGWPAQRSREHTLAMSRMASMSDCGRGDPGSACLGAQDPFLFTFRARET